MNQFGIRALCPAPRGCIDLVGKGAHGSRDRDTFRGEKGQLAFPIETGRRDRRRRVWILWAASFLMPRGHDVLGQSHGSRVGTLARSVSAERLIRKPCPSGSRLTAAS